MRFRAEVQDIPTLTNLMQSIQKVSSRCILRLGPESIQLICTGDSEGVQVWTKINTDTFFTDYRIESRQENMIGLDVPIDMIVRVLKSASKAASTTIRLAKRDRDAVLSFMIVASNPDGSNPFEVIQDVTIKIMKPAEFDRIREPTVSDPDVYIVLPKLQKLRTVVDRMRSLSDYVTVTANHNGELKLEIRNDEVKMETHWQDLGNPSMANRDMEGMDTTEFFSVQLELRSLVRFLHSYIVETTTIACICSGQCAIFYVYVGDMANARGVMTFFLPGIIQDNY